ncbi:OmpA family protein [Tropicimonas sp.]|uniref:OmpA family protein n=1 Tax=Tropicimonas sp. TaxID=2067044 RepID=UPI003A898623
MTDIPQTAPFGMAVLLAFSTVSQPVAALDPPPNATLTATETETLARVAIPVSGWQGGRMQTVAAEGEVLRQAWQIPTPGLTTLQIIAPLREQLEAGGYTVVFECDTRACGGFDFRYGLDLLPEPAMHVDLGDFSYLAAQSAGETPGTRLFLMASRTRARGFVQLTQVSATVQQADPPQAGTPPMAMATMPATGNTLEDDLTGKGRTVLGDLEFETGSSRLAGGGFASLDDLAAFLRDHPATRVALVGHTDTEGALDANIALSKRRAAEVAARLSEDHGIPAARLSSEGVGYLAPLTSNATPEGRTINRRVEVILLRTD